MNAPSSRKKAPPGLASIRQGREDRLRGKFARPTTNTWLLLGAGLVGSIVAYQVIAGRQLAAKQTALLGKQRAIDATLGAEWKPLREKVETATLEAAKTWKGDFIAPDFKDFRSRPGVFLRMRVADAGSVATLRKAAEDSSRDSFVACLIRPAVAKAAKANAPVVEPWNLRQAYGSTRILTDAWVEEMKASTDDLRLRVFEQQYEKAMKDEIPLAIDVVKKAEYFLLVLDEDVPAAAEASGGHPTLDVLEQFAHPARVHAFELPSGKELARVKRETTAEARIVADNGAIGPDSQRAMQRQVNNCAIAQEVGAYLDTAALPK
ncbi:MAG: hypothetical protein U0169_19100 [Polyangiaceae bacterium]